MCLELIFQDFMKNKINTFTLSALGIKSFLINSEETNN